MHSNTVLRISDTRRLSPQTTSSSGYHSDLSLTHESPRSVYDKIPINIEQYPSCQTQKTTRDNKPSKNNSLSQISTFLRKQYERVKAKLITEKPQSRSIQTCSKATSTTPLSHLPENLQLKSLPSDYRQSSFIEPVHSVYVHPLCDNALKKIPAKTYRSVPECYPQQPLYQLPSYLKMTPAQSDPYPFHRSTRMNNSESLTTGYRLPPTQNVSRRRHPSYSNKAIYRQNYYPYRYIDKNYDYNRSLYVPLSDFISTTTTSAFKPVPASQHSSYHFSDSILPSDDPCDLEVAQYFRHTFQWSNPNYSDIYGKQIPRKICTETLC